MNRITKKEFKQLHSTNQLRLIQACWDKTPKQCIEIIKGINTHFVGIEVSKCSIDNNGEVERVTCYTAKIREQQFYFVETINDASKDTNCSWHDIRVDTVVYVEITKE